MERGTFSYLLSFSGEPSTFTYVIGSTSLDVSFSCHLFAETCRTPPVRRAVLPHSSARHRPAHVTHVHASLMSRSLGLVGRREPSAMTLIRARDPKSWPTFRVDENRFLDGASIPFWILRHLVKPHIPYCRSLLSCVSSGISYIE